MTQAREPLSIMDGSPPSLTYSTNTKKGHLDSRSLAFILVTIYITSIIATGFLVYNFAVCSHMDIPSEISFIKCNKTGFEPTTVPIYQLAREKESVDIVEEEKMSNFDLRLPRSVEPLKYKIKLIPFIFDGNFTFNGEVQITIKALEAADNITIHIADIDIKSTHILDLNKTGTNDNVKIIGHSNDTDREFHIIHLKNKMIPGEYYEIFINYTGILNDNLHGFYRSSYDVANTTRWIAATQFQPTDARRAFPCFDEPALKSTFSISIAHFDNMTALSNMNPVSRGESVKDLPGWVWTHFEKTLPMSTYLVAFVVCDFSNISDGNYTVWARKSAIESAAYALDIGPKILKYFENFYGIKYPLPKMDMIALPDFNAGAMENWGLMTFRETAMLYDGGVTARVNKPRVATVIAHELAHQWFGNLVTPSWWADLWLNEGFASYVEYVGIDAVEKSWKSMDLFVIHEVQNVFGLDALASSHQISVEVNNPDEINEIFDRISYGKGASIIRMMDHFLTSDVFNSGISNYLKLKKYQSADQNDLWQALTEEARRHGVFGEDMSVKEIMDTWTLQTGYPVVTVTRDYQMDSMKLNQERFLLVTNKTKKLNSTKDEPLWWIPITYTSKSEANFSATKPRTWMRRDKDIIITDTNISFTDWVIVNIQQTGFYRVNYDEQNWRMIIGHLNNRDTFEEIPPSNRAQILDDALNLALGGRLSYSTALDVTRYLVHEREFVPWKAGLVGLGYIDGMLAKGPHYLEYKKYILSLIEGLFHEVGFHDDPDDLMLTMYKRIDVINIACLLEQDDCVQHAVTLFHNYMMTPNPDVHNSISPNLRNVVYCTSVRVGGAAQWNFVWERFRQAHSSSERDVLITALGCTRLPWLLIRYLDLSLRNNSGIRKQDVYKVFGSVSSSVIGQPIAFNFLRQNWVKVRNYLGSSASNLNTIVKYATRKMNSQQELDELRKFSIDNRGDLGRTIEQAIEKTEANIVWMRRNYNTIIKWLDTLPSTS